MHRAAKRRLDAANPLLASLSKCNHFPEEVVADSRSPTLSRSILYSWPVGSVRETADIQLCRAPRLGYYGVLGPDMRTAGLLWERVRLFGGAKRDNLGQTKDDCVCGEEICRVPAPRLRV